ncbi:MAG: hypothetical protein AAGG65_14700 [Pseudomonadota bacterium]
MQLQRHWQWALLLIAPAVVVGWLLFPEQRSPGHEEANTLLADALELFDQAGSEADPESRQSLLEHARLNLNRIVEEMPNTLLGARIAADDPIGWLNAYTQFLANGDACVRAITEECVLELAVQVAEELLVQENSFERATRSNLSSPFSAVRRDPVIAQAFSTELLEFVLERDIWFQSQSWLTAIASLQSQSGDTDGAIATANTLENVEQRDALLGFLVGEISQSVSGSFDFEDAPSRPVALDLLRSAYSLTELIESTADRDDALWNILFEQIRFSDVPGALDTIEKVSPGYPRDWALGRLSVFYSEAGDIDAAVNAANDIESVRRQSRAIMLAAEEHGLQDPGLRSGPLLDALSDLSHWLERTPDTGAQSRTDRPYIIANISQAYAALGEFETAFELASRIEQDSDLRARMTAELAGVIVRSNGNVDFALGSIDIQDSVWV